MLYKRIINFVFHFFFTLFYKRKFLFFGKSSYLIRPLAIDGINNISIGNSVKIGYRAWLASVPLTGEKKSELIIKDGACLGNFNHIYTTKSIIIGENVLTADKVYITDNLHSYEDISSAIVFQPIKQISTVSIGSGSWLGENVCIIGANIGKNCVIGANSVVTRDIPDYSVAVGSPAQIIKKYCFEVNEWLKTDKYGNFIV